MKRRPNFNRAVRALLRDATSALDEFRHIKASRLVVVAGEARRASRATVKPLAFAGGRRVDALGRRKPVVRIRGKRMLYCITLRPLFFRDSTPKARISTLLHELFHISKKFDGTLEERRRHTAAGASFARTLRPLVRRYLRRCPPELWAAFGYDGEVRVQQWLERPGAHYLPGSKMRRVYTEKQLFLGTVRMRTPRVSPRGSKGGKGARAERKVH